MSALDRAVRALRAAKESAQTSPRLEVEVFPDGAPRPIATAFLRNGECPLACVYCALYRQTTSRPATGEEIALQIEAARRRYPGVRGLKLYNASSLFEPRSIDPGEDSLRKIAAALEGLDLVVVEARSENAARAAALRPLLAGRLEVAIGLETADDGLLRLLNKPTSLARFRRAAAFLAENKILLRAFVLAGPPFVETGRSRASTVAAFDEARGCGARVVSILPVVSDHEAMEALRRAGFFSEVSLDDYFETVCDCAIPPHPDAPRPLVLAEVDSLGRLPGCPNCRAEKTARLAALNATGEIARLDCADHRPAPPAAVRRPRADEVLSALESRPSA